MIKNIILVFLLFFAIATPANALKVPHRAESDHYVTDTIDMISQVDEAIIRDTVLKLDREHRIPIVVVTIGSLLTYMDDGEYIGIEAYSKALFKNWEIGRAGYNYGVLVLVSRDDKVARIQFGGGWGFLYDGQAQRIMKDVMTPHFERGAYSQGIRAGVLELDKLARTEFELLMNQKRVFLFIASFIMVIFSALLIMIMNIEHERMLFQIIYSGAIGLFYVTVWILYKIGVLNYMEFFLIMASYAVMTAISLAIYTPIYAKNHSAKKTAIHILLLFVLFIVVPLAVLSLKCHQMYREFGSEDEIDDFGGGATDAWE